MALLAAAAAPLPLLRHHVLRLAAATRTTTTTTTTTHTITIATAIQSKSHPRFLPAMPYSVAVSTPALGPVPDSAVDKPHHVKAKDGSTSHYRNPHPSGAKDFGPWSIPLIMI
ncbi:hypothetical protein BD289DRAFT_456186, partial [Coniella lustricola]